VSAYDDASKAQLASRPLSLASRRKRCTEAKRSLMRGRAARIAFQGGFEAWHRSNEEPRASSP